MAWIILLILTGLSDVSRAGGMTSSGGEFVTTEKNPWFIGSPPVRYCLVFSNDFSVEKNRIRGTLALAIEDWSKSLNDLAPKPTPFKLPDGETKNITLRFEEVGCHQTPELQFYFGAFSQDIEMALKSLARYTAAFAGHESIDDRTGRAKNGIIWLAPDQGERQYLGPKLTTKFWSKEEILFNVLLHELGHLFGFDHQEDGLMNDRFPSLAIHTGLLKSTARRFVYHKWETQGLKICGNELALETNFVRRVLNSNYVILWDVCVQAKRPAEEGYFEVEISFISEKQLVKKIFRIEKRKGSILSSPVRAVSGKYFETAEGGPNLYKQHTFLSLDDSSFSGYMIDANSKYPIVFNKRGTRVEMHISKDNEIYDLNFHIDNLTPNFDEATKSQGVNKSKFK